VSRIRQIWHWLRDSGNQGALRIVGGCICAAVAATWALYTYTNDKAKHAQPGIIIQQPKNPENILNDQPQRRDRPFPDNATPTIPTDNWIEPVTGMEFVRVNGECFLMGKDTGSEDQKPVHEVCLDDFWISNSFFDFNDFYTFMKQVEDNKATDRELGEGCDDTAKTADLEEMDKLLKLSPSLPVVCISWKDASAFANWLGVKNNMQFSLPTEAEWEYTCRAMKATDGRHDRFQTWCQDSYDVKAYNKHSKMNPLMNNSDNSQKYVIRGPHFGVVDCTWRGNEKDTLLGRYISFKLVTRRTE